MHGTAKNYWDIVHSTPGDGRELAEHVQYDVFVVMQEVLLLGVWYVGVWAVAP